jgi:hypothetical protein
LKRTQLIDFDEMNWMEICMTNLHEFCWMKISSDINTFLLEPVKADNDGLTAKLK